MKNLTVRVPEHAYLNARIWAVQNNISLSAALRIVLEQLPTFPGPEMRRRMNEGERNFALRNATKDAGIEL